MFVRLDYGKRKISDEPKISFVNSLTGNEL